MSASEEPSRSSSFLHGILDESVPEEVELKKWSLKKWRQSLGP
jgi:hypothetical protein